MPAEVYVAEPGARYSRQPPVVVDCSVLAAVLFDEPEREEAALSLAGRELYAPGLIDHELVSVALKKAESGHAELARQGLSDLEALRLTRCEVAVTGQFRLAREMSLTGCDAAYLLLAVELGAPLVTFDRKLNAAAVRVFGG